jgi:hypothetical protein
VIKYKLSQQQQRLNHLEYCRAGPRRPLAQSNSVNSIQFNRVYYSLQLVIKFIGTATGGGKLQQILVLAHHVSFLTPTVVDIVAEKSHSYNADHDNEGQDPVRHTVNACNRLDGWRLRW